MNTGRCLRCGVAAALILILHTGIGWSATPKARSSAKPKPATTAAVQKGVPSLSKSGDSVSWQGREYRPIDQSGVYYYDAGSVVGVPMPSPDIRLSEAFRRNGYHGMVRCELVDYVDCTRTDHAFTDDGRSRMYTLADGEKYRLTGPDGKLSWYSYVLATRPTPGRPHLVVVQSINDIERYTTVTLTVPKDKPWSEPYAGEESFHPECQEDDGYHPDVGGSVYTGREYPLDGKPLYYTFLYYPKASGVKVTVSHVAAEEKPSDMTGAAAARIWIFDILDPIGRLPALTAPTAASGRRIGLYVPHPWFMYSHYGTPSRTPEQRRASLQSFVDYMKFCGFNELQFHVINGSDVASRAWYDSKLYKPLQGNLIEEFLPLAAKAGISVVPIVTPIFTPYDAKSKLPITPDADGFSYLSLQLDRDGQDYTEAMGKLPPDPLRPEVQEWMFRCLREVLDRAAKHPSVTGVGFRVNGKIGLCYVGNQNLKCAQDTGYSEWDISEFEKDTGVKVPRMQPTPYGWLRANAWEKWIDWRCRRMHDFWLKARDLVQSYRKDLKLVVACDLPSEYPGYNIEWVEGTSPRDLMRHHGYDPELFRTDEGILIQRGMMINSDRFFCKWGAPHGTNAWAHKAFNYAPGVVECYQTPAGQSVEFYHNYWEEVPHPDPEYGTDLRTATAAPWGPFYFEPATYSLRKANAHTMMFMGWERASIGHEHDLRRFSRAFLALPNTEPRDFDGKVEVLSTTPGAKYERKENPDVWVRWFGDRLAVVNDTGDRKQVSIVMPSTLDKGKCIYDYAADRVLVSAVDRAVPGPRVKLDLLAHDLVTLGVTSLDQSKKWESSIPMPSQEGPGDLRLRIEGRYGGQEAVVRFAMVNRGQSAMSNVEMNLVLPESWQTLPNADGMTPSIPVSKTVTSLAPGKTADFAVRVKIPVDDVGKADKVDIDADYEASGKAYVARTSAVIAPRSPIELAVVPDRISDKQAGDSADITFRVKNALTSQVDADIRIEVPPGWRLQGERMRLPVPSGGTAQETYTVIIPANAKPGRYMIFATATAGQYTTRAECVIDLR